jgi:CRISPR/Cas system-associated protein Cas10 (large subunit of type III CRISPR-Cas system)
MSDALESYLTVVPDTSDREEAEKDILLIRRLQTRLAHANALHDLTVMENPHGNA